MTALCPCGKRAWTSKDEADRVVVDAKIRAGLKHSTRRREQRSYACPTVTGIWHVTSQTGTGFDPTTPPLPDYPTTDDEAAGEFVSDALRHQNDTTWAALMSNERVEQTCRVLAVLHQRLLAQGEERAARLEAVRARYRAREATLNDVDRAAAEKAEWKARVAHFRAAVVARLDAARQGVKALNVARSESHTSRDNIAHRDALRLLTLAVTRHLHATDQPTPADLDLWWHLTVLTVPHDDATLPLADMVAGRHWADGPDEELRRTA